MMDTFTSIFHEEVIAIDEFKGEAENYYEARRLLDRGSHLHDKTMKDISKGQTEHYRDKGSLAANFKTTDKHDASRRIDSAKKSKEDFEEYNNKRDTIRSEKQDKRVKLNKLDNKGNSNDRKRVGKSVKESFLDFDII